MLNTKLFESPQLIDDVMIITDEMLQEVDQCTSGGDLPQIFKRSTLHSSAQLVQSPEKGRYAVAKNPIKARTVVFKTNGTKINRTMRYSVQVGVGVFRVGLGCINHVCQEPTLVVDPETVDYIARRDIMPGEELTINYLTFEYDMRESFTCFCRQNNCFGIIRGFKYLHPEQRQWLAKQFPLANHLRREE